MSANSLILLRGGNGDYVLSWEWAVLVTSCQWTEHRTMDSSNFVVRVPARYCLNQVMKLNITNDKSLCSHAFLGVVWSERTHHHCDILTAPNLEFTHEKTSDRLTEDILSNPTSILLCVRMMKEKKRPRNSLAKETQPVEIVWYPGQDNGHLLSHIYLKSSYIKSRY